MTAKLIAITLIIALVIFAPFMIVWALNVIGLSLSYSFETWLAVVILIYVLKVRYE